MKKSAAQTKILAGVALGLICTKDRFIQFDRENPVYALTESGEPTSLIGRAHVFTVMGLPSMANQISGLYTKRALDALHTDMRRAARELIQKEDIADLTYSDTVQILQAVINS